MNCKSFWASLFISSIFYPSIHTKILLLILNTSTIILTPQAPPFCLFCLSLPPSPLSAWWWWRFFLLFSCMACLLPPSQSPQTANPTRLWFCAWKMKMVNFKENVLLLMRTSPLNLSPVILSARSFSLTHSLHLSLCVSLCSVCETSATSLSSSAFHTYICTHMYCTYKKYSGGIEIVSDGNTMVLWYTM